MSWWDVKPKTKIDKALTGTFAHDREAADKKSPPPKPAKPKES
jgi:hypothetical protein